MQAGWEVGDAQWFALRAEQFEHGAVQQLVAAPVGEREGAVRQLLGAELDRQVPDPVVDGDHRRIAPPFGEQLQLLLQRPREHPRAVSVTYRDPVVGALSAAHAQVAGPRGGKLDVNVPPHLRAEAASEPHQP